jgi:hypothetical protein
MKGMADDLGDLGEVIQDRTLVLNILRGLNEQYSHMAALLKRSRPFPTFDEVRNDLLLEELTITKTRPSSTPSTALASATPKPAPPSQPAAPAGAQGAPSGNSGKSRNRRKGGNKGGTPWPSFYNPLTGIITMWPGPNGQQQKGGAGSQLQRSQPQQVPPSGYNAQQQALLAAAAPYGAPLMYSGYPSFPVNPPTQLQQQLHSQQM